MLQAEIDQLLRAMDLAKVAVIILPCMTFSWIVLIAKVAVIILSAQIP